MSTPRSAVITGAAQGIGRTTAEAFARAGWRVALIDLREPQATLESLHSLGAETFARAGDITDERVVDAFARETHERFGGAEALVNNAGIALISRAELTSAADYRHVLDVNLVAPFLLAKAFGARMLEAGHGSIVNVASVAGLVGVAERAAYNASKHGLIGLTRTLAAEWGGRGVRVNAVCPGWVKTEMDVASQSEGHYSDADITGRVPMGRFAAPEDVAQAILFLADQTKSRFINGAVLPVDGGWTADGGWESLRRSHQSPAPPAR
ncbi:MAG: SDR family oxidoreductase [Candidatus Eisenbacteria bacterium]|uniref:SDR family oxidoreductase n=1 Tax=Eiseniibacteriota bacterium TaxID=2212470 RepID=A0A849SEC2_UNCEI|nr:SDR family oxidoreductase [Candidatus Eisenbacteria bacterium]